MPPSFGFPLSTSRVRPSADARVRRGFALLITIVLVAFLVLILVGLATFVRVETQVADNSQQLAKARQNALFALNVAVGRLQREAGPDQRVTATAEVLAATDATKRKWTGVWDTTVATPTPAWLVSSPNGVTPLNTGAAPTLASGDVSATAVRLVGDATADPSVVGDGVIVPLQDLRSNGIPGLADDTSGSGGHLIGRFGYWVGDEGVKARVNLSNPFVAPWKSGAVNPAEEVNAAAIAQRAAIERIPTGVGAALLDDHIDTATAFAALERWVSSNQLPFYADAAGAGNAAALSAAARVRFHDMTVFSAGVQSDVRLGGLKRDLTAAFELSDADFRASIFGTAAPAAERTRLLNGDNAGLVFSAPTGSGSTTYKGPTWHLLRNHYRLYQEAQGAGGLTSVPTLDARNLQPVRTGSTYLDVFNGAGVNPDPKTNDSVNKDGLQTTPRPTHGALMPYVQRVSLVFSLQTVSTGDTTPDGITIYRVRIVVTPYVVLHNPYAVRLNLVGSGTPSRWGRLLFRGIPFDHLIQVRKGAVTHEFTKFTSSVDRERAIPLLLASEAAGAGTSDRFMNLYVPSMTLEPGEVRVFSADLSDTQPIGAHIDLAPNAYYSSGYYFDRLNTARAEFHGQAYTRAECPTGVGGALELSADDYVKVPADWNLSLGLYASQKSGANNSLIIRYHGRTQNTGNLDDDDTLYSELYVQRPQFGSSTSDVYSRTYSGYDTFEGFRGGQPASTYTGTPTPMFAYDVFVKPADQNAARAARPFVTSNPLALVSQRESLGEWSAAGHPLTQSAWQPAYRTLSPNAWTNNEVFAVDAGGNGRAYWGPTNSDTGLQQVTPLSIPVAPMTSLAQFQHLPISLYGNEPALAIGNSWATPYVSPTATLANPRKGGIDWWTADLPYLANEGLWDRAFFSTLAPGFDATTSRYYTGASASDANSRESVRDGWLGGTRVLPNSRVQPYRSPHRTDAVRQTQLLDPERSAAHLLLEGAFNINSRSVAAWTAILGGARQVAVRRLDGTTETVGNDTAIPRALPVYGESRDSSTADEWNGFAHLTDAEISDLATRIVTQITARQNLAGRPFLSLAEFINRRIAAPADDILNSKGALQAAIDASSINSGITGVTITNTDQGDFPHPKQGVGKTSSAAAGFLSQADLLQQIGPLLSARSDTFTLRTYGENINPVTGDTDGRAWCEAVVQRVPDYVTPADAPEKFPTDATLSNESRTFGRRFEIVSFRWLGPEDI